jgi:redox-sensitive bicupin YhaK (pirin superfamily)
MKRIIKQILGSKTTIEGAGVRLKRVFGYNEVHLFDPFLLLDHFGSEKPEDYIRGFPWHPHRGIETVTYVLNGEVEHGDSMGNSGLIRSGDIQWMTAGSGIIHQEMPRRYEGLMQGFQLWVNLTLVFLFFVCFFVCCSLDLWFYPVFLCLGFPFSLPS